VATRAYSATRLLTFAASTPIAGDPPPPVLSLEQLLERALPQSRSGAGSPSDAGQAPSQPLGQPVNLVQSTCGYTMTLKRVYADADRVIVGYTIVGPTGRSFSGFETRPMTLTDMQGHSLAWNTGGGVTQGNEAGQYTGFDASGIPGHPSSLTLHLVVRSLTAFEILGAKEPARVGCETYPFVGEGVVMGHDERWVRVAGPLTYDFTVPVSPSRMAELHQVATSGGTTATLERIAVTPYETTMYFRGITTGQNPFITLSVNGRSVDYDMGWTTDNGLTAATFDFPWLYNVHGEWMVTVKARSDQRGWEPLSGGPGYSISPSAIP